MVKPRAEQLEELGRLTAEAEELLNAAASRSEPASDTTLRRLEQIAEAAAKISFGSASPELLTQEMHHLVAWTDHMDDPVWVGRFRVALATRPLISPWTPTI